MGFDAGLKCMVEMLITRTSFVVNAKKRKIVPVDPGITQGSPQPSRGMNGCKTHAAEVVVRRGYCNRSVELTTADAGRGSRYVVYQL